MTEGVFYSDRVGLGKPRVSEIIFNEVWAGMTALIQQRINDGSLARAFPRYDCLDDPGRNTITGKGRNPFEQAPRAGWGHRGPPRLRAEGEGQIDPLGVVPDQLPPLPLLVLLH
ncbi:hypothetical protein [Streptomyces sp. NPDC003710]